jgi:toxin ParE1/3/4
MTLRVLTSVYRDMSEIWNYIAQDNATAANQLEERLFAAMKLLQERPGMGHERADVSDTRYRFWAVGSYVIAYQVRGKHVTIRRVIHGARDFRELF